MIVNLEGKEISIYNTISNEKYDALEDELQNEAIKNANNLARDKAKLINAELVLEGDNLPSDMSSSLVDNNTGLYYIDHKFSYKVINK